MKILTAITVFTIYIFNSGSYKVFAADDLNSLIGDSSLLNVIVIMLVLTLIPTVLLLMTSYTRILIILSFTRNALGTQQMPPNQVLIGIALVITFFIMSPVISEVRENAYEPYTRDEITITEAIEISEGPMKEFMFRQARSDPNSLNLFLSLAGENESPGSIDDIPLSTLIPAFVTSELTKAFKIGFLIYIPFIMIDMIVSSILMSMGMMMLPPAMISLPFKILFFVLVDGWQLIIKTIITSFG